MMSATRPISDHHTESTDYAKKILVCLTGSTSSFQPGITPEAFLLLVRGIHISAAVKCANIIIKNIYIALIIVITMPRLVLTGLMLEVL